MTRGKAITTSEKILIARLHLEKMTYREIAEEVGLSKISICRCINNDKETKEIIQELEQRYKDELFNQCIDVLKTGFMQNNDEIVRIDGKTTLEMILQGYKDIAN